MKILHTADWHLDLSNLEYTVPAIEAGITAAGDYDLFVHAGDLAVNRSNIHPHVSWQVRKLIEQASNRDGLIVAGNHDQTFQEDRVGMVEGILDAEMSGLTLASKPKVVYRGNVAFVCIPTPNKYWAKSVMEEGHDIGDLLHTMVQGKIGEAREVSGVRWVAVVYHGTVGGCRLSDEVLMPSQLNPHGGKIRAPVKGARAGVCPPTGKMRGLARKKRAGRRLAI